MYLQPTWIKQEARGNWDLVPEVMIVKHTDLTPNPTPSEAPGLTAGGLGQCVAVNIFHWNKYLYSFGHSSIKVEPIRSDSNLDLICVKFPWQVHQTEMFL